MKVCHEYEESLKAARATAFDAKLLAEYQALYLLHCGRLQLRHASTPLIRPTARAASERRAVELLTKAFEGDFDPSAEGPISSLRRRRLLLAGHALLDAGVPHDALLAKLDALESAALVTSGYALDEAVRCYARRVRVGAPAAEVLAASLPPLPPSKSGDTEEGRNRSYALRLVQMLCRAQQPEEPLVTTDTQRNCWRALLGLGAMAPGDLSSLKRQIDAAVAAPDDKDRPVADAVAAAISAPAVPQLSRIVGVEFTAPTPAVNERVMAKHKQLVERIQKVR